MIETIETSLVYIHITTPTKRFIGCGALIEGGYVATCRHVWQIAVNAAARAGSTNPIEVEVELEYPHSWRHRSTVRDTAILADACDTSEGPLPDLVFLKPKSDLPANVMSLQLARKELFETGIGYAFVGLKGLNESRPNEVQDISIKGTIDSLPTSAGLHQFTGENAQSYWSKEGSSGSPVFRDGGQQLAGILSLSDLGDKHVALVVPATTIRRYLVELVARQTPATEGVNPVSLRPILEAIGETDVPVAEIPNRLRQFVDAARARAEEPVHMSNEGSGIDFTIGAARTKLRNLDTTGARTILTEKIVEEEEAHRRRLIPLLEEEAVIERLGYDYDAAKVTLQKLLVLDPERIWSSIELGDLFVTTGKIDQAASAFRHSLAIAERLATADPGNPGWQRDLSISHNRIGDVERAQGNLAAALTSYQIALGIAEGLATADPGNPGWRRDLSVSHNRIGDAERAQGNLAAALTSYQTALEIRERLATADPGNADWQRALSVSHNNIGDVQLAQGNLAAALTSYQTALEIRERLATDPGNTSWRRDLSVSHDRIGEVQFAQDNLAAALTSYQTALEIRERLATGDPGNPGWQHDLSVSHNNIGNVQRRQGNLAAALTSYQTVLAIRERLATGGPGNPGWQHDLALSYGRIASIKLLQGIRGDALKTFWQGRVIIQQLMQQSLNASLLEDLAWFDSQISSISSGREN